MNDKGSDSSGDIDIDLRPARMDEIAAVLTFWAEAAHGAWAAAGYQREEHWRRWVRPLV